MATSLKAFYKAEHSSKLLDLINSQRGKETYCDVVLTVDEQRFPVHKTVLAASSEYFDRMFSSKMREHHENVIPLMGVTTHAMTKVLDFIYTGKITLSDEDVTEILEAASLMIVLDLQEFINSYLIEAVKPSTCLHFRNLGNLYSLEKLVVDANRCLHEQFEEVSQQPDFNKLEELEIKSLISSDEITVKYERTVFEAVLKWVKYDPNNRKQSFPSMFQHIRLQIISIDYLTDNIRTEPYVRECLDCRDLVEDAFHFHVDPRRFKTQEPRKGQLYSNTKFILCFGSNQACVFDINEETWTNWNIPNQSLPASSAIAFVGKTTVFCGGQDTTNQPTNSVIGFNGSIFLNLPSMLKQRMNAAAVYIGDALLVFGGEQLLPNQRQVFPYPQVNMIDDFELYDKREKKWAIAGKLKTVRSGFSCVAVEDHAYLIGGYKLPAQRHNNSPNAYYQSLQQRGRHVQNGQQPLRALTGISKTRQSAPNGEQEYCALVETYDHNTKKWLTGAGANMNTARALFGAAYHSSRIYVFGGQNEQQTHINTSEFMSIQTGQWTNLVQNLSFKKSVGCCAGNKIYALGHVQNKVSLCVLDTSTNQWTSLTENNGKSESLLELLKGNNMQSCHSIASIYWNKWI